MIKKICSVVLCGLFALNVTVFATPTAVVTKDEIYLTSQYSGGESGKMYSVDLYDSTYNAENPLPSLVFRNQEISGPSGWWGMTIPMKNKEAGVYRLASGEESGTVYTENILYDKFDGKKTYNGISANTDGSLNFDAGAYLQADFADLVSDNLVKVSFDIQLTENSNFYMRLNNVQDAVWNDKTQIFDTLYFNSNGKAYLFTNENNWSGADEYKSWYAGREYHVELWVDMLRKSIAGYVDNTAIGKMPLADGLNKLGGLKMTCSSGSAKVSNFEMCEFPEYGTDVSLGNHAPDYAEQPIYAAVKVGDDIGNIIFGAENVDLDISLLNRENKARNYTVKYNFYDADSGVLIGSDSEDVSFLGNEKLVLNKKFDFTDFKKQYGFFKLVMSFSENSYEISDFNSSEFRFSVARKSSELNKKMGIHTQFGHGYSGQYENITLAKNAGFYSIRDYVADSQYSAANGWVLPERYTIWHNYAKAADMNEILHVYYSANGLVPTSDAEIQKFAEYAGKLAANTDAEYIELFNELNLAGDSMTTADYAKVLMATAEKIHPVKKTMAMVTARAGAQAQEWIKGVLDAIVEAGGQPVDYIDSVSVHPYKLYNLSPETGKIPDKGENDGTLHEQVADVRALMNRYGLEECPIFASEIGWTSTPVWSGWAQVDDRVTEYEQAEYTIRASVLLHEDLECMYWHTMNDKLGADVYEEHFGIVDKRAAVEIPFEAKPAFIALAQFNSLLANAKRTSETENNGCYDAVFNKNGKTVHVLWTDSGNKPYEFNAVSKVLKLYDMYGNESIVTSEDGKYNMQLSTSPIYAEILDGYVEFTVENANMCFGQTVEINHMSLMPYQRF